MFRSGKYIQNRNHFIAYIHFLEKLSGFEPSTTGTKLGVLYSELSHLVVGSILSSVDSSHGGHSPPRTRGPTGDYRVNLIMEGTLHLGPRVPAGDSRVNLIMEGTLHLAPRGLQVTIGLILSWRALSISYPGTCR